MARKDKDFYWNIAKTKNHKEKSEKKTEKEISLAKRPVWWHSAIKVVTLKLYFYCEKRQQKIKERQKRT